jgi:hypothetical protein
MAPFVKIHFGFFLSVSKWCIGGIQLGGYGIASVVTIVEEIGRDSGVHSDEGTQALSNRCRLFDE